MRHLTIIVLSIALYAPQVAKVLAYADCTRLLARSTQEWCDCMITASNDDVPAAQKQADIQLKTDWKFVPEQVIYLTHCTQDLEIVFPTELIDPLCHPFRAGIFHPPLV